MKLHPALNFLLKHYASITTFASIGDRDTVSCVMPSKVGLSSGHCCRRFTLSAEQGKACSTPFFISNGEVTYKLDPEQRGPLFIWEWTGEGPTYFRERLATEEHPVKVSAGVIHLIRATLGEIKCFAYVLGDNFPKRESLVGRDDFICRARESQ